MFILSLKYSFSFCNFLPDFDSIDFDSIKYLLDSDSYL